MTTIFDLEPANLAKSKKGHEYCGNPEVVECPYGKAIRFNGVGDGIFIAENPVLNYKSFTIEVIFRPDSEGPVEQRFIHIGEPAGDRLLIETRTSSEGQWYLDTFILSGQNQKALIDTSLLHPGGQWYHVALTLDQDGLMSNYVNGKFEMNGTLEFKPFTSGQISIGVRQNRVSWFKGDIYRIRISNGVLKTKEFLTL
jgi:hypothetical protein